MIKCYSDLTKEYYEDYHAAATAEKKFLEEQEKKNKTAAQRKAEAHVEELMNNLCAARAAYDKALHEYCKEYGPYKKYISNDNVASGDSLAELLKTFVF